MRSRDLLHTQIHIYIDVMAWYTNKFYDDLMMMMMMMIMMFSKEIS
jgi:hypothetical protein